MKQNITVEQLNELSENGKERLKEIGLKQTSLTLWNNGLYTHNGLGFDGLEDYGFDLSLDVYKDVLPLLSIGQMIGFLGDNNQLSGDEYDYLCFPGVYSTNLKDRPYELADALWEAVKEVSNES